MVRIIRIKFEWYLTKRTEKRAIRSHLGAILEPKNRKWIPSFGVTLGHFLGKSTVRKGATWRTTVFSCIKTVEDANEQICLYFGWFFRNSGSVSKLLGGQSHLAPSGWLWPLTYFSGRNPVKKFLTLLFLYNYEIEYIRHCFSQKINNNFLEIIGFLWSGQSHPDEKTQITEIMEFGPNLCLTGVW